MKLIKMILFTITLSISTVTYSDVEINYHITDDIDNTTIERYDARYYPNDFGVGIGHSNYTSNNETWYFDRLILSHRNDNHDIDIELLNGDDKLHVLGNGRYILPTNTYMEFGLERDIIDSYKGLSNMLFSNTYYYNVDLYSETLDVGLALVPSYTTFDDNGYRKQLKTKLYKSLGQSGVHVYARTRNYSISEPYNGVFFSPEDYSRYLFGLGFRRVIGKHMIMRGHYDYGRQYVDGYDEPSSSWSLSFSRNMNDSTNLEIRIERDDHTPEYHYEQFRVKLSIFF